VSFSISVERQIARWQQQALIDAETASLLKADLEEQSSRFSLGSVLATLGGLLLGAAVIMLVAANWQDMPRLMRIGLVFALIWIGYLGGAWRQSRGDAVFSSVLYVVGAASFGAGIALVGQMYHLSGDVHAAALYWAFGVLAAAFLMRAPVLAAFAAGVGCFYLMSFIFTDTRLGDGADLYRWFGLLLLIVGAGAALFTRSRHSAHLWALYAIGWALFLYFEGESGFVLAGMIILGLALMLADAFAYETLQRLTRFARPLAAYGLLLALLALAMLQVDDMFSYTVDQTGLKHDIFYGIVILVLSIAAIALCGRDNGSLRSIAYTAFSVELLYLAFETVGTMIGTSGFFLTAGVLVLLLAAFVRRMERRFGSRKSEEMPA